MPAPRFDRLLTLNFSRPLGLGRAAGRLPILMYHSISDKAEAGLSPYYRTATSPERFREQMQWLKVNGCCGVTLSEGLSWLENKSGKPKAESRNPDSATLNHQPVAITFDDGYRDFYTAALPVLRQHHFGATMFLPTAYIGPEPREFKGHACMTWDEVREAQRAGIEFGSHTVNHPKLYDLDLPRLRAELQESRATLERELDRPVRSFAYPYAFPSADRAFVNVFVETLKACGYASNVTTKIGLAQKNDDPFTLKRLPINSADDEAFFLAKLAGAYDWLAWPQETFKKIRRLRSGQRSGLGRAGPSAELI